MPHLVKLNHYVVFQPMNFRKNAYYYVVGAREKYIVLHMHLLVENIANFKNFIDALVRKTFQKKKLSYCFVCFNPVFSGLAKQVAIFLGQKYLVGRWPASFFSRKLFKKIYPQLVHSGSTIASLDTNALQRLSLSVFPTLIFITMENTEFFFKEIARVQYTSAGIVGMGENFLRITYPIFCDSNSLPSVYFYTRLVAYFLKKL